MPTFKKPSPAAWWLLDIKSDSAKPPRKSIKPVSSLSPARSCPRWDKLLLKKDSRLVDRKVLKAANL